MPSYSDAFRSEAVIKLMINRYDYNKTAAEFKIPERTLRNWEKDFPKKGIGDLLDRAIERLLSNIPEFKRGSDWAIALGILLDKWLLMQGEPTQRTESFVRTFGELTDAERTAVVEEAERIIASLRPSNADEG